MSKLYGFGALVVASLVGLGTMGTMGTVSAIATASGASAPPGGTAVPSAPGFGTLWVLNAGSLSAYAPGANGNAKPIVTIKGARTRLGTATDLAVTASGGLWVTDPPANALQQYASGARGNVAPAVTISGAKTLLSNPVACAVDRAGNLWVLNDKPSAATASITEYASTAHGNVAPVRRISGAKTRLFPASGIAAAPGGQRIWVTHVEAGSGLDRPGLQAFSTAGAGDVAPVAAIAGRATTLDYPGSLAIDDVGQLVVANDPDRGRTSSVLTFAPGAHGNVKPIRWISGSRSGLVRPGRPALDGGGNIWVPNPTGAGVRRFRGVAWGNRTPARLLRGNLTGIDRPRAVAVFAKSVPSTP